jgi:hypothetical protein
MQANQKPETTRQDDRTRQGEDSAKNDNNDDDSDSDDDMAWSRLTMGCRPASQVHRWVGRGARDPKSRIHVSILSKSSTEIESF